MNFLYDYHSIPKCINACKRSMRLCRQNTGGEKYEQAQSPAYDNLVAKNEAWDEAVENSQAAKDKVRLCDRVLDNLLIKLNHSCADYDKLHTGSFTRTTLFPNGNYLPITSMNIYKEPAKALETSQKLETFGATHELFPFVAQIKKAVDDSNKAIAEEAAAINAEGSARAAAEVAKLQLIRKYNSTYHQAADEGGDAFAECLFPDLGSTPKKDEEPGDESKPSTAA